jgi:hypothetical protein
MTNLNYKEGYDVLSGEVDMNNPCNLKNGKVHTGDAWLPARNRYCTVTEQPTMPVALIVFGDKSQTDLHGTLLSHLSYLLSLYSTDRHATTLDFGDL